MTKPYKPTLLVDFDGVIHHYSKGWHDGTAYDGPMPGAKRALFELENAGYEVIIFSTRDADQIRAWMNIHGFPPYRITNVKEPAIAIIDDRAITFRSWPQTLDAVRDTYPIKE